MSVIKYVGNDQTAIQDTHNGEEHPTSEAGPDEKRDDKHSRQSTITTSEDRQFQQGLQLVLGLSLLSGDINFTPVLSCTLLLELL